MVEGTIKTILRPGTLVGVRGHDTIDLGGRYLTPGIVGELSPSTKESRADSVDMHSHLGTWSQPRYEKGQDMEELSGPVTPHFRAIDGFDPSDEALPRVVRPSSSSGNDGLTTDSALAASPLLSS